MKRDIFFPTTIVDGFFDNPDEIRNFALDQQYNIAADHTFPGKRTDPLHIKNPLFFNGVVKKIHNLFYRVDQQNYHFNCSAYFQLVDESYISGWIHRDDPYMFTVIVYLTPGSVEGTSLYVKKDCFTDGSQLHAYKQEAYSNQTNNLVKLQENNSLYEETVNIKGIYNRMVLFDGIKSHGAHKFFGEDKDTARLTLIMFFRKFDVENDYLPIPKMNMGYSPTIL